MKVKRYDMRIRRSRAKGPVLHPSGPMKALPDGTFSISYIGPASRLNGNVRFLVPLSQLKADAPR